MKTLKNAKQKNVLLDTDFYSERDIKEMLDLNEIFFITKDFEISHSFDEWCKTYDESSSSFIDHHTIPRVFLSDLSELKVIYNRVSEEYQTVGIRKNNAEVVHVTI